MKKIIIIGSPGAGKSTLARQLGEFLHMDVYHMDTIFWMPGWKSISRDELIEKQKEIIATESWVLDGDYHSTLELRLAAADTIVFLNMSRHRCLYQVIKRRFQYKGKSRPDRAAGCREQLEWSFLKLVWQYPRTKAPGIVKRLSQLQPNQTAIILRSPKEVAAFLHHMKSS
ncbi:DNA topology modulation protein [Ectobacillus sp. JY-23]|uniref:DNA topology modulation protein n=1 Tax=Ectobacillus sp. JY-23 TaxID=2933872 RepID=UPI001FF679FD|nr:DNA topology modulation protein [Ectobacillus sp. JY-23]UOY91031.1 DNA topology modulation protein [Ectobacillus sp. JY-23]